MASFKMAVFYTTSSTKLQPLFHQSERRKPIPGWRLLRSYISRFRTKTAVSLCGHASRAMFTKLSYIKLQPFPLILAKFQALHSNPLSVITDPNLGLFQATLGPLLSVSLEKGA